MNRAASFLCWAASVALVLSVPSAYAGTKVVSFPNKIRHTTLVQADALNVVAQSADVPEQVITDKTGSNVVKFKPKGNVKVPKSAIKGTLKSAVKGNFANIALGLAITGAVAAVGWVMSDDNTKAQIKNQSLDGQTVSSTNNTIDPLAVCQVLPASKTMGKIIVTTYQGVTWAVYTGYNNVPRPSGYTDRANNCTSAALGYTYNTNDYTYPSSGAKLISVNSVQTSTSDPTDSDLTALDTYVDGLSLPQLQQLYTDLYYMGHDLGDKFPEYLLSNNGLTSEKLLTAPQTTAIARLNPDGSTSRLTQKSWYEYGLNYHTGDPNIDVTTTQHNETYNDAGQKVEDETTTDPADDPMPALSPALGSANDPLKDWAADVGNMNSKTVAGVPYPLLFTYGGTCSSPTLSLPIIGNYSLNFICDSINSYVKPILGVLFAAWTALSMFGIWRETTTVARAA